MFALFGRTRIAQETAIYHSHCHATTVVYVDIDPTFPLKALLLDKLMTTTRTTKNILA
jgi:hypothetical protein